MPNIKDADDNKQAKEKVQIQEMPTIKNSETQNQTQAPQCPHCSSPISKGFARCVCGVWLK